VLTALILALLFQNSDGSSDGAQSAAPMPQAHDIQGALTDRWIKISSTGFVLHDYAVRNVRCVAIPVQPSINSDDTPKSLYSMSDKPVSQVRCSYDYASQRKRNARKQIVKHKPRIFTERELKRIPAHMWFYEEREFLRISRTACLYMSRTPNPGECDDYWAAIL
jgi:hypothetical protein